MKNRELINFIDIKPKINESSFIAIGARVIGNVELKECVGVWYNTVIRGDVGKITIGKYSNIQDNSTIHTDFQGENIVGDYVSVGHGVILHNTKVGNNTLIGNGAIVLDLSEIGNNVIIAAGTVIPPKKIIPNNVMVMGNPFKIVKELGEKEIASIKKNALRYWALAQQHIESYNM